jgi:hypothetical protein
LARLVAGGRPAKRDQVAIKVGERFLLVQAEDIVFASLADESITIVTGQVTGRPTSGRWMTCRRGWTRHISGGSTVPTSSTSIR